VEMLVLGGRERGISSPDTALTKIWIVSSASDGDEALDEILETLLERMTAEFEGRRWVTKPQVSMTICRG